ncbi:M24 family metallopeptidase [Exiguobacterium aurantiacum]|uniref:M24 family metallopeptidase n=1 Tax=Exiguobacterium aurantiacum TaxID=33987 RepID=UPI0020CFCE3F|nr:Xaa-Pro peptidase family protein [Exiguobacterium aurantiacum]
MNQRTNHIAQSLATKGLDAAFVTSKASVFYFSGVYAEAHERLIAILVLKNGTTAIVCPALEKGIVEASDWNGDIVTYMDHENPWDKVVKLFLDQQIIPERIGVEGEHLTYNRVEQLRAGFAGLSIIDLTEELQALRMIKSPDEVRLMKRAAELADMAIEAGIRALREGVTELEVIAEIEYAMKKQGVREMSFDTLVLFGENSADPHGVPGNNRLKKGDFALFDLGVIWQGYASDITRTVVYGEASTKQREIYETVLKAEEAAIAMANVGTTLGSIDIAARQVITTAGYGEYFTHRVGHGIGIEVHEFPSMAANNDMTAQVGMTFTVEPGIYLPGVGGVRIEDDIVMTESGPILLTSYPKTLQEID